jgi:serine phosphatase RsbU (regulator of sigma subunit)
VIGVLHIGTMTTRQFRDDDVELLQLVAERASHAVQARLSRLDRAATLALQRSLLPGRPPAVAGLDVAARYLPGTEIGVGGDWYDLFTLPSGQIGLAIGDVVGSGLRAAVVMGRIRSALRAYALESADPADVLTRLDRKIQLFEPEAMATAIYAAIDVDHEALTMSSAGHLPPIIVEPDQPARLVDLAPDLPLGAHAAARRHSIRLEFPRDTALFLYTDGLVERRDRPIAEAVTALMAALVTDTADEMCTSAVATLVPDLAATDDIALLAIRRN